MLLDKSDISPENLAIMQSRFNQVINLIDLVATSKVSELNKPYSANANHHLLAVTQFLRINSEVGGWLGLYERVEALSRQLSIQLQSGNIMARETFTYGDVLIWSALWDEPEVSVGLILDGSVIPLQVMETAYAAGHLLHTADAYLRVIVEGIPVEWELMAGATVARQN